MKFRKKLLYFIFTFLIWGCLIFSLGEGMVRLFYSSFRNYNMEMWRYTSDLKIPLPYENLPFHHYPNKKGNYYGVEIATNQFGFRDNISLSIEKDKEVAKRIMFIGDSFTLGWGVQFDSTFSKLVQRDLQSQSIETINLGIGNYNAVMEVELFKKKGLPFNPDIVVLMYFINDVEAVPKRTYFQHTILSRSYFIAFLFDRFQKIKLTLKKDYNWQSYYQRIYEKDNKALKENREALKELIQVCAKKEFSLLIVNIPELHELENYPFPFATDFIRNIAVSYQVPFLDLKPNLETEDPSNLWVSKEDAHANEMANNIISKAIQEKLMQLGYID